MTETPGPRRSTRATSTRAGSATPAPSVSGRRTRAKTPKAAPLPAVATSTSYAYGAIGKVSLNSQVDVSGGEDGFAAAFDSNRGAAINRDAQAHVEDDVDQPVRPVVQPAQQARITIAGRPAHAPPSSDSRARRAGSARLGQQPRATSTNSGLRVNEEDADTDPAIIRRSAVTNDIQYPSFSDLDTGDPAIIRGSAVTNDIQYPSFTDLDTAFSYSSILPDRLRLQDPAPPRSRTPGSMVPPATRAEIDAARPSGIVVFGEALLRWLQASFSPLTHLSSAIKNFALISLVLLLLTFFFWPTAWKDISDSGATVYHKAGGFFGHSVPSAGHHIVYDSDLTQRVTDLESDVRQIRKEIRSATHKLEEILPKQLLVQKNEATGQWDLPVDFWNALRERLADEGSSIAWDGFISANKAKLDEAAQESIERAALKGSHIVNQEMFIERIEQIAGEVASSTTTKLLKALPSADKGVNVLYTLALSNIARNTELAIQTVNYFSWGLGAVIVPGLTSPTQQKRRLSTWQKLVGNVGSSPIDYKPVKVLQRWEEQTDCWCAAESTDKGKAQVGVLIPQPIVPTSITIEHIPARGTLDIGAAPKEFEVWVINTEHSFPPENRVHDLSCGDQPAKDFVCIGKGKYDIHAPNHIQNFGLQAADLGAVNKAVVKVKNNWGKSYTCIYRIRLHGENSVLTG